MFEGITWQARGAAMIETTDVDPSMTDEELSEVFDAIFCVDLMSYTGNDADDDAAAEAAIVAMIAGYRAAVAAEAKRSTEDARIAREATDPTFVEGPRCPECDAPMVACDGGFKRSCDCDGDIEGSYEPPIDRDRERFGSD